MIDGANPACVGRGNAHDIVCVFPGVRHKRDPFRRVLIVSRGIDGLELYEHNNVEFCDFDIWAFFQERAPPWGYNNGFEDAGVQDVITLCQYRREVL